MMLPARVLVRSHRGRNSPPLEIAQNEEDERSPEELSDPVASVRQAL
jgi:hypothetical protein